MPEVFDHIVTEVEKIKNVRRFGKVVSISGLIISCTGLERTALGSRCLIEGMNGDVCESEVIGYKKDEIILMPFGLLEGVGPGCRVYVKDITPSVVLSEHVIGRVLNALGEPIDSKGPLPHVGEERALKSIAPAPGKRASVGGKLDVGVRALNAFVPICEGQRMGIFSGSGVGKSVLMSMVAKYGKADINVLALVGERGREVKEFIEEHLGEEGLKKSVVIVATGDEPSLMRRQAAYLAMTVAEYFRDQGNNVMLFMDSVTRFAFAQREIGLSSGEPPTTRGFTPSVFAELPRLLERAGPGEGSGTITGIFTVLVEGGDLDEPVADSVRGIVDGHIVLSRTLAERGHFPAIDILKSVSRMLPKCHDDRENELMRQARKLVSTYTDMEELIRLGAYAKGSDPQVDMAIDYHDALENFLVQMESDHSTISECFEQLENLLPNPQKVVQSREVE